MVGWGLAEISRGQAEGRLYYMKVSGCLNFLSVGEGIAAEAMVLLCVFTPH